MIKTLQILLQTLKGRKAVDELNESLEGLYERMSDDYIFADGVIFEEKEGMLYQLLGHKGSVHYFLVESIEFDLPPLLFKIDSFGGETEITSISDLPEEIQ